MERYLSLGVSTIVALMAAHRAATGAEGPPYSQEQIARIDAYLREDKRPAPPTPRRRQRHQSECHACRRWERTSSI
jgi:hypothetical protein